VRHVSRGAGKAACVFQRIDLLARMFKAMKIEISSSGSNNNNGTRNSIGYEQGRVTSKSRSVVGIVDAPPAQQQTNIDINNQ
jgi:hypothetical protein